MRLIQGIPVGKPLTTESQDLQAKRERILKWAGRKWALHPDNASARITPMPHDRSKRRG